MGQYANKKPITAALEFDQYERLKKLSERTRVPMQEYLREAVEMVLKKYEVKTVMATTAEGAQR